MQSVLRWTARVASLAVLVLFAALWVHAPPRLAELHSALRWQLLFLSLGVAGLVVGFWRERFGGLLALLGFVGFLVLEGAHLRTLPVIPAIYVMALPALLYLIVGPRRSPGET